MFDPGSRYEKVGIEKLTVLDPDGQERIIRFARRRFIPDSVSAVTLAVHTVVEGDRLDRIAANYLGDPLQFWRLADGNGAMRPEDLCAEPGRTIRVTLAKS